MLSNKFLKKLVIMRLDFRIKNQLVKISNSAPDFEENLSILRKIKKKKMFLKSSDKILDETEICMFSGSFSELKLFKNIIIDINEKNNYLIKFPSDRYMLSFQESPLFDGNIAIINIICAII